MIIIAKLVILTVVIVMALKVAMSEGMIFEKVGKWLEDKSKGNRVYEMFICPWCMNSLQGITAHLFAFGLGILPLEFNWQLVIRYPIIVFASSFISGNLWNLYETINRIKEKNEAETDFYLRALQEDQDEDYEGEKTEKGYLKGVKN